MSGIKGKSRIYGSNTCVLLPCGYVVLRAVLKVSLGYVALAFVLFALQVCVSSICVVCPASMWLYGRCV